MTESKISSAQAYSSQRTGWSLLLLVVLVTGIVLRFKMLGMKSLWLDEASSVAFVRLPWREFLRTMWYGEANMAFYYLLLRFWLHLVTASSGCEASLRCSAWLQFQPFTRRGIAS